MRISDASIKEGDSGQRDLKFEVRLSHPSAKVVTTWVRTEDGTATAGEDYVPLGPQHGFWFLPGETKRYLTVKIHGDVKFENDEQFHIHLSDPANATLERSKATGTIIDDDKRPVISIADASVFEGDAGTKIMEFSGTLSGETSLPASVNYRMSDGTTIAGEDYQPIESGFL